MLVGEAPGEREDEHGLPFVGPSGVLLGRLLARAEVPESALYMIGTINEAKGKAKSGPPAAPVEPESKTEVKVDLKLASEGRAET